ncbi:hypothetical protein FHS27_000945 [Rhodopirellula rubra]|uniref:Uncharacterized protein n=1 Tax=Aporhodopirellula rubra TaxID=980271 RepID=A0A7W5H4H5_9BACT|nr:hypothetical protein [Aporhodopirellula rubra]
MRMNRRQWIAASARWSLASVIGVVGWVLTRRRLQAGCSHTLSACRDCVQVSRCVLPAATLERAKLARKANEQSASLRAKGFTETGATATNATAVREGRDRVR